MKFASIVAAVSVLTVPVFAHAFEGGRSHHHGSPALMACMAAAPSSVKTNLRSAFKDSTLVADRQAVETARQNLAQQILAKNSSLSTYETALSQAQLKVTQDEDALAQNACGQLSASQLAAASTLYTNLQNNRQAVRGYFTTAQSASGDSANGQQGSGE